MLSHCSVTVYIHNNLYINMLIPLQERLHVCLQSGGEKSAFIGIGVTKQAGKYQRIGQKNQKNQYHASRLYTQAVLLSRMSAQ